MYLYKNLRTNIISQKDEDDEEAIDLKKDLKVRFLKEFGFTDKIIGLFKSIQKQMCKVFGGIDKCKLRSIFLN